MKRTLTRASALLLSLTCLTGSALAASPIRQSSLQLSDALTMESAYVQAEKPVQEKTLIYRPGGDVRPMVVYGDSLYGRSTMDYVQSYLSERGYTAVGAVNAAFFDMANGLPIGMVVTDGILRANGTGTVLGIDPDGTAKIGEPTLEVRAQFGQEDILLHYNQLMVKNNGMILYSRDYDTKTKSKVKGYHVILQAEKDKLTLSDKVQATVVDIVENTKSCPIPKGGFVLSLAEDSPIDKFQTAIRSLKKGDSVTLTTTIDPDWQNVAYAVGGGDLLVENGSVCSGFQLDSAERHAARTAVGIRADGQVVVFAADKSSTSGGLTLPELASRMAELGCVQAVNLDGGGSTTVGITRPGERDFLTVNEPADGQQRPCANFLFFVRPTTEAGPAARLHVYPYEAAMLPGGELELTVRASDSNYMMAQVPGDVSVTTSNGIVNGRTFIPAEPGSAVITAQGSGISGSAKIDVVKTPTTMEILRQDNEKPVETILIESGTTLDLTAQAQYEGLDLLAQDRSFRWDLLGDVGTIDENGLLAAGAQEATGLLTVTCGDLSTDIPMEVRINPMVDLEGHWAREYISNLYFRNVLNGGLNGQGELVYRPDDSMTRQEFIVAMMRWLQVDTSRYADTELPFADSDKIADWAVDAMKAAYELGYVTGSGGNGKVYGDPTSTITREAAMTMLARTQNVTSKSDALDEFKDKDRVSDWAVESLTAMVEQGVINGMDGKLQPQGRVTRAQVAKMLFFMNDVQSALH